MKRYRERLLCTSIYLVIYGRGKHESLSKAIAYDIFTVVIYRKIKNGSIEIKLLVGHTLVELSSFLSFACKGNIRMAKKIDEQQECKKQKYTGWN